MTALIGISALAAVSLTIFGVMFRRIRSQAKQLGEHRFEIGGLKGANRELEDMLHHATRPDASIADALRVRKLLAGRRAMQDDVS